MSAPSEPQRPPSLGARLLAISINVAGGEALLVLLLLLLMCVMRCRRGLPR